MKFVVKRKWYVAGLHFECQRCANCCSGPTEGFIWTTRAEIEFIADFLKEPIGQVRKRYLKRIGLRNTLIERPQTKDCIFLRKIDGQKKCMIYPVRPSQCRNWPFWSSNLSSQDVWNNTVRKCGGINRGRFYSFDQIEKIRKQTKWWIDG
jgi:hypothetical protein